MSSTEYLRLHLAPGHPSRKQQQWPFAASRYQALLLLRKGLEHHSLALCLRRIHGSDGQDYLAQTVHASPRGTLCYYAAAVDPASLPVETAIAPSNQINLCTLLRNGFASRDPLSGMLVAS